MLNSSTESAQRVYKVRVENRCVGVVENGIFKKNIRFSKHSLRKPPALALAVKSIEKAEHFSAHGIEITDIESGRIYSCTIEYFKQYAWRLQRGGFEPQMALNLNRWTVTEPITYTQTSANIYDSNQTAILTEPAIKEESLHNQTLSIS